MQAATATGGTAAIGIELNVTAQILGRMVRNPRYSKSDIECD